MCTFLYNYTFCKTFLDFCRKSRDIFVSFEFTKRTRDVMIISIEMI